MEKIGIPRTCKKLMSIIGTINWFRPYIKNLSMKIYPITNMLQKGNKLEWTNKHTQILQSINCEIKEAPLLSHADYTLPFQLQTDASDYGIGAVLLQNQNIIGYFSRKLSNAQQRYTIMEKECLAVVEALNSLKISYGVR